MRKSRPWAALIAVVVLAALVVLSGCQGAVGKAGEAGEAGEAGAAGPAGPAGPAGTSDNASPVPATVISTVYLALNGDDALAKAHVDNTAATPAGYIDKTVDLSKLFTDAESPTLSYTAVSTDKTIATAKVTGEILTIKGAKADSTTITVTAFDGVNDGVEITIDVIVVTSNSAPTVSVTQDLKDLTSAANGAGKLTSNSAKEVPFTAVITAGVSGEATETITSLRAVVGAPTGAATDPKPLVEASVKHVSGNNYILTVTRLKSGENDATGTEEITIFAVDSFGAETMVDLNGPAVTSPASLVVEVNAPPRLVRPLPAVVYLYRVSGSATAGNASVPGVKVMSTVFTVTDFFAVEMDFADTAPAMKTGDTTCSFSTNPLQPTGYAAVTEGADPSTLPAVTADLITTATRATVSNGDMDSHFPTSLVHGDEQQTAERASVTVNSAPAAADNINAAGVGSFVLTITCTDAELPVTGTTRIEVLEAPPASN